MTGKELQEALAHCEHESWARWMVNLFGRCEAGTEGSVTIPTELVERWQRQIHTPYADLSEPEKQSDRDEVAHTLPIIETYVTARVQSVLDQIEVIATDADLSHEAAREAIRQQISQLRSG